MTSITLRAGRAGAEVAFKGGELRAWSVDGKPLIWKPDPSVWPDTAPILFPVVGWTNGGEVRVAGRSFPLGLHGFARTAGFNLVAQSSNKVTLELVADAASRALYPFDFRLRADYCLSETGLSVALIVENRGGAPMPYACGLHPGFCWPFAGGSMTDYRLVFDTAEDAHVPEISAGGLFLPTRRQVPLAGTDLALAPELFAREALCFLHARSRALSFEHSGGAAISVAAEGFPHFALWAKPPAPFLSIETWTGHGDPEGYVGDLFDKPGMRILAPGEEARHAVHFAYRAGRDGAPSVAQPIRPSVAP